MRRSLIAPCILLLCSLMNAGCAASRPFARGGVEVSSATLSGLNASQTGSALPARLDPDAEVLMAIGPMPAPQPEAAPVTGPVLTGGASFYHPSLNGNLTANGETYSDHALTAASLTLKFGTRVRVTNLANQRSVVVRINDRGPYVRGRVIDLTRRAASELGFVQQGVTKVRIEPI
jgi:rare lipoprotein A